MDTTIKRIPHQSDTQWGKMTENACREEHGCLWCMIIAHQSIMMLHVKLSCFDGVRNAPCGSGWTSHICSHSDDAFLVEPMNIILLYNCTMSDSQLTTSSSQFYVTINLFCLKNFSPLPPRCQKKRKEKNKSLLDKLKRSQFTPDQHLQ